MTFSVGEKDGKNALEPGTPVLTVVSPRGKVKSETGKVLLDFLVIGCPIAEKAANPDSCRVRYKIDTEKEVTLAKEEAVWLDGVPPGKHAWVVGITKDEKIVPGSASLAQGSFEARGGRKPGGAARRPAGKSDRPVRSPG